MREPPPRAAGGRARPAPRGGDAPTRRSSRPASSRSSCRRARRSCGWPGACRGCSAALRPALAHFQHALPLGLPVPGRRHGPGPLVRARPAADGPRRTGSSSARVVPRSARRAARVLAVSERTTRDLVELYGVPDERIVVTPNGVDPAFTPGDTRAATTSSSSARSRSARTRSPPRRRPRAVGRPARRRRAREGAARSRASSRARGADLRGYVAKPELAELYRRAACVAPPVALRGLRAAGRRGDGVRDARRRGARAGAARGRRRRGGLRRAGDLAGAVRTRAGRPRAAVGGRARAGAARSPGRRRRGRPPRSYREVLAVSVSAVVVSHGHAARARALAARARAAGRRARRRRERPRQRRAAAGRRRACSRTSARSSSPRTRTTASRRRAASYVWSRTRTRCPSRTPSRALRAFGGRTRAAASPARGCSTRTARGSRRAAASRPSRGTLVRRTPLRPPSPPLERQRTHYLLDERPTEPVQADSMLGAFLLLRRDDARRARRLRPGLPPLRRGHRPLLPRRESRLGALVRARRGRRARLRGA